MDFLLKGISWGFFLAVLTGPLLFTLIQTGIERGIRLGTMVGIGIWVSDLLFILAVYYGAQQIAVLEHNDDFKLYLGIIGGLVLIAFGVFTYLTKPVLEQEQKISASTYGGYFLQGFLINTINPFTVIFWISITSAEIIAAHATPHQSFWFYSGILGTIIVTDFLKVVLAKKIRPYLKPHYLFKLRKMVGIGLFLFGVFLMIRVIWG